MVITGLLVFAAGALVASLAHTATILLVGDALIEGAGAAMMSSSSLALISNEFTGKERAGAFGLFGGVAGIAGALGPVVGGWLTTDASWRWAFRINVVLAPVLVVLILAGVREVRRTGRRPRIDLTGVVSVTAGLFFLVFAIIEAPSHGWWKPLQPFTVGGDRLNPQTGRLPRTPGCRRAWRKGRRFPRRPARRAVPARAAPHEGNYQASLGIRQDGPTSRVRSAI